ncbi:uncharacterized protein Bfra_007596 [Botrytis fragariae]|uniref:Uncharacterized protein n=1 Tax=Botrytis fragariae TaxID=1964551 RepID=A0A8H6APG6_9HELO|nr:uncharacterized protein Bfra_007596 [Botrytis fragariae]KAF5871084.1 hypothetical protein Bfra_007596 [Botrytis fragariae]
MAVEHIRSSLYRKLGLLFSFSFTLANVENVDQDIKQSVRNKVPENVLGDPAPFPFKFSKKLSHDTTHSPKSWTLDCPLSIRRSERCRQIIETTAHAFIL